MQFSTTPTLVFLVSLQPVFDQRRQVVGMSRLM